VYPKLEKEYLVKTRAGATVSIIAGVLMGLLFMSELMQYLTPERVDTLRVDPSVDEKLRITFNISFPALSCAEVMIDAMDVAGDQQLQIDHAVFKTRLDAQGSVLGEKFQENITADVDIPVMPDDYCGSCYGARGDGDCCNTCDEVIAAYTERGWGTEHLYTETEQCQREKKHPASRARKGEGCNVHGTLEVNKVSGNFHVAPGRSSSRDNRHVHQFNPADAVHFNTSHIVHHLSFGEEIEGQVNALDGVAKMNKDETALYQYFIKLVTTEDQRVTPAVRTNQYSVTEKTTHIGASVEEMHSIPGVFFVYEPSPFLVTISTTRPPLTTFLVNLCAIVGGAFTIAGFFDSLLYHTRLALKKSD